MYRLYILIFIAIILCFSSCGNDVFDKSNLYTVNLLKNYPEKELILQDLFDIEYVVLETNDTFLTQGNLRSIGKKYIVIKNDGRTDGDIFLFDRSTGKGIRKINRLGQGGEEYVNILDVFVDEKEQELFVNTHYINQVNIYNIEGAFKRKFKQLAGSFYDQMKIFDEEYLICHDGFWDESWINNPLKKNYFLLVSRLDGSIIDIPIPYDRKISSVIWSRDGKQTRIPRNKELVPYFGNWLLMESSSDTIYQIDENRKLNPWIVRKPSVQKDATYFLFPAVYSGRYQFMQKVKMEHDFQKGSDFQRTDLIYDNKKNAIYEAVVYNNDYMQKERVSLTYDLSVLQIFNNEDIAFTRILQAPDLVEAYKDGKLREGSRLKEIAAKLDDEDNPVIMIGKYKKQ